MAATQYQIFCRYYASNMSKCITNTTNAVWSASTDKTVTESKEVFDFYTGLVPGGTTPLTETQKFAAQHDLQNKIVTGNQASNPKFDMFFIYNGRDLVYSNDTGKIPYVIADKMERIAVSPWFIHSTHASLPSAISKAQALIKKIGKDNVRIGKTIPLEQYIEIV